MLALYDVTAMSLVYYSRDIGVKSLALYFIEQYFVG
jgi:hypothetical protein